MPKSFKTCSCQCFFFFSFLPSRQVSICYLVLSDMPQRSRAYSLPNVSHTSSTTIPYLSEDGLDLPLDPTQLSIHIHLLLEGRKIRKILIITQPATDYFRVTLCVQTSPVARESRFGSRKVPTQTTLIKSLSLLIQSRTYTIVINISW